MQIERNNPINCEKLELSCCSSRWRSTLCGHWKEIARFAVIFQDVFLARKHFVRRLRSSAAVSPGRRRAEAAAENSCQLS